MRCVGDFGSSSSTRIQWRRNGLPPWIPSAHPVFFTFNAVLLFAMVAVTGVEWRIELTFGVASPLLSKAPLKGRSPVVRPEKDEQE